jgi:hypothetical protein
LRNGERKVNAEHVCRDGDLYYQDDGQIVRVLHNGDSIDVVVSDPSNRSGVRVTGFGAKLSGPSMRCCICSLDTERPDYLDLALRTRDGDQARQYLGAHPDCLQSVMAPGFTVEVQEVVIR